MLKKLAGLIAIIAALMGTQTAFAAVEINSADQAQLVSAQPRRELSSKKGKRMEISRTGRISSSVSVESVKKIQSNCRLLA